ncbi:MAG: hypothetical protein COS28_02985 [Nitrospirae bacterium CG02_land_8_20_14_3_00_44_33]|nr:MAG: hypothetical protein AUJ60_01095 [Nitrospirae bacterium CG1_02_44_142]PIV42791.1 MAG: hypothetical protein COS28_02985 [Nitrospirae bacterium CG02_land_8_20_14_3_00_44_33]PIV67205.1 MAG: hypothetical protein COS10_02350 [Nitrospirae bacterium CG01_land_8_20_14_3_00_44_22]PIW89579.1 MAG: hypothetical protein COZ93_04235 [Nitrospirae bacterium CG_4_8_14_3_um_filter_44_28]
MDKKILIIDDEPAVIDAVSENLKAEGYEILSAKNGKEGLELFHKKKPVITILDLKMPVMDGIEFMERIKLSASDLCSVIVMTGYGNDEDMKRCFELGAGAFLRKPVNFYELKGIIKNCIELKQAQWALVDIITERKQTEDALRRSEEKFLSMLSNIHGMIYRGNSDWTVEVISNSEQICGYTAQEFQSQKINWLHIIHSDDRNRILSAAAKLMKGPVSLQQEYRITDKKGGLRYVLDSKKSFFTEGGEFLGVDGIVFDITERKKTEMALIEAKKTADEANRVKSEFLANMSHELTTPLNSVIGFSQILQDGLYGELNVKQKEYVSDILNSGQHLLHLITDMIDLSQATYGGKELKLSRFLLKDMLKSSTTAFNEEAMKHNLKLSLDIEPEADIEIEADSGKLGQIMFNLLSNAVKFTPEGGSVRVSARRCKMQDTGYKIEDTPLSPPLARGEVKGGLHRESCIGILTVIL